MSADSRDMQWCYWRGELVLARQASPQGRREFVIHGTHWHADWAKHLVDEEDAINGEAAVYVELSIGAQSMVRRLLKVVGLTMGAKQ